MSRIQKIFEADSDDDSDYESDCSESCNEEDKEDIDEEAEEEVEEEVEEDEEEEEEHEEEEHEEDDLENTNDEDDENDDEDEEEEENNEEEENDDLDEDFEDFDDFEKDSIEAEKSEKTVIKKNKTFQNFARVQAIQQRQKCTEHSNIREDGKKFLCKLFHGHTSDKIERLEKSMYNYCTRNCKTNSDTKEFKRFYSFELYSIMSNYKNNKNLNEIKDFYLEDIKHFDRGTYIKEGIEDEKKLKLITHVSEPVAGIHKCKCGCDKVYSYELQTRSGDEGMTVFLQCYDCGRKWKL